MFLLVVTKEFTIKYVIVTNDIYTNTLRYGFEETKAEILINKGVLYEFIM